MQKGKQYLKSLVITFCVVPAVLADTPCGEVRTPQAQPAPPEPQLTHMCIDVLEVRGPAESLIQITPAMFEDHTRAERTILEAGAILERLREFGQTRLTARLDTQADMRQRNTIQEQHATPAHSSTTPRPRGSSANVQWTLSFEGSWLDARPELVAAVNYRFDYRGVWPKDAAEQEELQLLDYSWSVSQSLVQTSGMPVILTKYRPDAADGSDAMVTVLRLEATRLDPAGKPMVTAPMPDQIHMGIVVFELSGSRDRIDAFDPDALASAGHDTPAMQAALQAHGKVELLTRPNIMVNEGQIANITVGENVPIVQSIDQENGKPEITYEDIGFSLDVHGVWLDRDRNNVRLTVDLKHTSIGSSSVNVGASVNLPTFTKRTFTKRTLSRVLDVADGRTGWIIGETMGKDDKASRLIVGIKPHPVHPGQNQSSQLVPEDISTIQDGVSLTPAQEPNPRPRDRARRR